MGAGLGLYAVKCSACGEGFHVTKIDDVLIGKYICPHCGVTYTEQ